MLYSIKEIHMYAIHVNLNFNNYNPVKFRNLHLYEVVYLENVFSFFSFFFFSPFIDGIKIFCINMPLQRLLKK